MRVEKEEGAPRFPGDPTPPQDDDNMPGFDDSDGEQDTTAEPEAFVEDTPPTTTQPSRQVNEQAPSVETMRVLPRLLQPHYLRMDRHPNDPESFHTHLAEHPHLTTPMSMRMINQQQRTEPPIQHSLFLRYLQTMSTAKKTSHSKRDWLMLNFV